MNPKDIITTSCSGAKPSDAFGLAEQRKGTLTQCLDGNRFATGIKPGTVATTGWMRISRVSDSQPVRNFASPSPRRLLNILKPAREPRPWSAFG